MSVSLLVLSIVAQASAAILALRLNVRHGRSWAWTLIAAALVVMTGRRILTLIQIASADTDAISFVADSELSLAMAATSCLASILFLFGVAFIEPVFQALERAESVLRKEHRELQASAQHAEAELVVARQIQHALLPQSPPTLDGFEIAAFIHSAHAVGGDYFDYVSLTPGEWALVVADASGHGVGPAIQVTQLRASLHILAETPIEVGAMLTRANHLLQQSTPLGHFVTAFVGLLDPATRRLRYCGAGHEAIILRSGAREKLASGGLPLGLKYDAQYTVLETQLEPGDVLVITTDGLTEACSTTGERFGPERLLEVVSQYRTEHAANLLEQLSRTVAEWRGAAPQHDDETAMIVRALPEPL